MTTKGCRNCGTDFYGGRQKIYCSQTCNDQAFRKRQRLLKPKLYCLKCNTELTGIKRKFCSNACGHRHRVPLFTKEKSCEHCGKTFVVSNRSLNKRCCSKSCHLEVTKQQRRLTQFQRKLKRKNLSEQQLNEMIQRQDNRCAICRKVEVGRHQSGKLRDLAVDHCHETTKTRGLLCTRCNTGIGLFNENWLVLENAIEYLAYHHCKHGSSKVQAIQESPILN